MSNSLLLSFRLLHRKIASVLFIFFFFIALTGLMLGWKSLFSSTIYENKEIKSGKSIAKWLPLDTLEKAATTIVNEKAGTHFTKSDKVELRLSKASITFFYKNITVQLDGVTGSPILIEKKYGSIIQDIHDGAIIDEWIGNKSAASKKIYTSILGLALLLLTITGFYLWLKPKMIKQQKKN